jgi:hypothetical protein
MKFGFDPEDSPANARGWKIGLFESNASVVSNCFIPMLICEAAYRQNPSAIGSMSVFNSLHMKEHQTFKRLALNFSITKDRKAWFESGHILPRIMAKEKIDAVVTHQWEASPSHLSYELLYGGYPLIHNFESFFDAGVGFYYPGFEAMTGAARLIDARAKDSGFWRDYASAASAFLDSLSPEHPGNISKLSTRISRLLAGGNSE